MVTVQSHTGDGIELPRDSVPRWSARYLKSGAAPSVPGGWPGPWNACEPVWFRGRENALAGRAMRAGYVIPRCRYAKRPDGGSACWRNGPAGAGVRSARCRSRRRSSRTPWPSCRSNDGRSAPGWIADYTEMAAGYTNATVVTIGSRPGSKSLIRTQSIGLPLPKRRP